MFGSGKDWAADEKKEMQIRRLEPEEHGKTRKLYETVFFQDEKRFVDYYYTWKTRENVIYAAENETGFHAMLHLNPVKVSWQGAIQTIYYIVAVATEERYRHQGLMRRMLRESLADLFRQQAPYVFLMPAAEAIYTPFDFHRAWEWRWEEEAVLGGEELGREHSFWYPLEACSEQQLEQLSSRMNEMLSRQFEMFTWRSPEYYRNLNREQQASGGCVEVLAEKCREEKEDKKKAGEQQSLSGCLEQKEQPEQECLMAARCTAKEAFPPMMTRIVHLERFFEQIKTKERRMFFWKVEDEILPENNGCFAVSLSGQGGTVRRLEEDQREDWTAVRIAEIPKLLGDADPFRRTMICEVV